MFSNLQGKTSATGTTVGENIRREMGIANLDSMKDTPTISLRVFRDVSREDEFENVPGWLITCEQLVSQVLGQPKGRTRNDDGEP